MTEADLLVGVVSGPLHAARFTSTPTIGVWMPGHYPSTYTLPRREQLNVVLADPTRAWNKYKRVPWNIVEHPGGAFQAERLADFCAGCSVAAIPGRPADRGRRPVAAMVGPVVPRDWQSRCATATAAVSTYCLDWGPPADAKTGLSALGEGRGRTGSSVSGGAYPGPPGDACIQWTSPGTATCAWTQVFGETVNVVRQDSVEFLGRFPDPIDVLYLDSLDTTEPGHAEHAWREVQAALPKLHAQSLLVFDDTPWQGGAWIGKGALAVPRLLAQGWAILYAGLQVVLPSYDIWRRERR
jgi:hypothetical protein